MPAGSPRVRLRRETTLFREAIEMSVDDRGTHQPEEVERETRSGGRRLHAGGRHRRGRAAAVALEQPLEGAEPLFTAGPSLDLVLPLALEPPRVLTYEPRAARRPAPEPMYDPVLRPLVDDLIDLSGRPLDAAPATAPDSALQSPRPGLFGSFRRWWRDEAMARAAQKRAFAAAEAIIRAQVAQEATNPLEKSPTPESYAQAIRGVMSLTEERFQSLGLRSDRLQDELRAISRTMGELRGILVMGGLENVGPAAASALGTLQLRFDALLAALSEELSRRAAESDHRLAEQLTLQSAELATLLESAVERIRAAIPEAFETVRAAIPQEMARVREEIPREFQRVADSIPVQLERIREDHARELEHLREAIPEGFETVREIVPAELSRIVPEQVDRVREASAEEFERIRAQIPDEIEKVRLQVPMEIERLRATIPEALDRVRGDVAELSVVLHEVIAQFAAFTSAASGEGDGAEPR